MQANNRWYELTRSSDMAEKLALTWMNSVQQKENTSLDVTVTFRLFAWVGRKRWAVISILVVITLFEGIKTEKREREREKSREKRKKKEKKGREKRKRERERESGCSFVPNRWSRMVICVSVLTAIVRSDREKWLCSQKNTDR